MQNMIAVIIAGGSGTRLWPLSTPDYPKHLLKINDASLSLLQNTYKRAKKLADTIYVVSEVGHIQHVKDQLPELPEEAFIVEPARRGTASCIIAALTYLAKRHDKTEPIAILPADHYIRDIKGFVRSFRNAGEVSAKHNSLVLVGVEPVFAATGFGYIQKDGLVDDKASVFRVDSFKEKPNHKVAQEYLNSGNYLWNCGYFVGSVSTFETTMQQYAKELFASYKALEKATGEQYQKIYLGLENISIDYALIEKAKNLLVVPALFDWMDLGSFGDIYRAVDQDDRGNHTLGNVELEEVQRSFVQNHEDKPVAVIGLDNVVVVNTKHGILVTRKDLAQKVGDVSKRFNDKLNTD